MLDPVYNSTYGQSNALVPQMFTFINANRLQEVQCSLQMAQFELFWDMRELVKAEERNPGPTRWLLLGWESCPLPDGPRAHGAYIYEYRVRSSGTSRKVGALLLLLLFIL